MKVWLERRKPRTSRPEDSRTEGQVDHARVIHSASFRRLQGKTQILNLGDSDFYRTRLTHSLEVAQIARGIAQQFAFALPDHPGTLLLPDFDLLQAIGLTHDLGHPPFGHGGEVALNYCMRDAGGFEGNGQTLRILGRLEKFQRDLGANLMRRTMLGVLKYPAPFSKVRNPGIRPSLVESGAARLLDRDGCKPPKCYLDCDQDAVDWILDPLSAADRDRIGLVKPVNGKHGKPQHKSFDCSIMDLADDIGFGVHDLEDAIALGFITREAFADRITADGCPSLLRRLGDGDNTAGQRRFEGLLGQLFSADEQQRKEAIGALVNHFITEAAIATDESFEESLLRYRAVLKEEARSFLDALIGIVRSLVIHDAVVQQLEFKGQTMVVRVFEALSSDPLKLLPQPTRIRFDAADGTIAGARVICDHIAGMTDGFLLKTYERLFSPRMGSVFDRL